MAEQASSVEALQYELMGNYRKAFDGYLQFSVSPCSPLWSPVGGIVIVRGQREHACSHLLAKGVFFFRKGCSEG